MKRRFGKLAALLLILCLCGGGSLVLAACGKGAADYSHTKPSGGGDFDYDANLVSSDYNVDGVLDEEAWSGEDVIRLTFGLESHVKASIIWGEKGLTFGFELRDSFLATSRNYNDSEFVIKSDNVELFIDTKHDGGAKCRPDDYQFNINPDGQAMLQVGGGTTWGPWTGVVDYAVTVDGTVNDDSDIDNGWCAEIFLPYATFGLTKDSTVGIAFGSRLKTTNLLTSEWYGWSMVPDPQNPDSYTAMTKNGFDIAAADGYDTKNGGWSAEGDKTVSTSPNSIALLQNASLTEGTFSASMTAGAAGDNGIVFGLESGGATTFWEDKGVSYYFFMINKDGNAFLAKVADKTGTTDRWTTIQTAPVTEYDAKKAYELKVVLTRNKIFCFIDGTLMITYEDSAPLSGTGVGLRAQNKNVAYTGAAVTDDVSAAPQEIEGWKIASGEFLKATGGLSSNSANALAVADGKTVTRGTVSATMRAGAAGDNGIVFCLDDGDAETFWEDKSYYFFFINFEGIAILAKVDEGWESLKSVGIAGYDVANSYKIAAVADHGRLRCYVNDQLVLDYTDGSPLTGIKTGVRAQKAGTTFTNFEVSAFVPSYVTAPDGYKMPDGVFTEQGGAYVTTSGRGMLVSETASLVGGDGTVSVSVKAGAASDNGLVFGLNDGGADEYWEAGMSYYVLIINFNGDLLLGKITNGVWSTVSDGRGATKVPDYSVSKSYRLKAVKHGGEIRCYADDVYYYTYNDPSPLTGTQVGFRAAAEGVSFTGLSVSADIPAAETFKMPAGRFRAEGDVLTAQLPGSMAVSNSLTMTGGDGAVSAELTAGAASDNGIVFGLNDGGDATYWEEGKSYYFLFINLNGDLLLAKVTNGAFAVVSDSIEHKTTKIENYDPAVSYTVKAEKSGGTIRCYVGDTLMYTYEDATPLSGTQTGVRAAVAGVRFAGLTVSAIA